MFGSRLSACCLHLQRRPHALPPGYPSRSLLATALHIEYCAAKGSGQLHGTQPGQDACTHAPAPPPQTQQQGTPLACAWAAPPSPAVAALLLQLAPALAATSTATAATNATATSSAPMCLPPGLAALLQPYLRLTAREDCGAAWTPEACSADSRCLFEDHFDHAHCMVRRKGKEQHLPVHLYWYVAQCAMKCLRGTQSLPPSQHPMNFMYNTTFCCPYLCMWSTGVFRPAAKHVPDCCACLLRPVPHNTPTPLHCHTYPFSHFITPVHPPPLPDRLPVPGQVRGGRPLQRGRHAAGHRRPGGAARLQPRAQLGRQPRRAARPLVTAAVRGRRRLHAATARAGEAGGGGGGARRL